MRSNARKLHPPERVAEYTATGGWTDELMDELLRARVAEAPDLLAVVDPPNKAALMDVAPLRLTWAEVDEAVDRLACVLVGQGLDPGDVLGVQLANTVELVCAYLAAWRIGLVVCPLPVQFREHEKATLGRRAEMRAFLTSVRGGDRKPAEEMLTVQAEIPSLQHVLVHGTDVPPGAVDLAAAFAAQGPAVEVAAQVASHTAAHPADPNDCITICWTSGTTSTPKGVPRCHYDWLAISCGTIDAPRLTADDVMLNPFPMVNMAGISAMFLPWLRVGGVFVQHHPFDLPTFLSQIAEERVTYTVAPPALLTMLLRNEQLLSATDVSSLRIMGSGSAPLAESMVRGWQEQHDIGIINFFGSNEGTALLTDPHDVPDPVERARFFPRYGAAGANWTSRIAQWTKVRLVDLVTGEDIEEPGRAGEVRIKGPTVFAGYLPDDAAQSPFDEQGYLCTGDVFRIAGDRQQFFEFVDREKDLIIRGGTNIAPAEIEGLIAGHPAVADVAVLGYPDEVLGERVCAVVVVRDGAQMTLEDLGGHLRDQRIASFKLPERLEIRQSLPRNPVGKVRKGELRDALDASHASHASQE